VYDKTRVLDLNSAAAATVSGSRALARGLIGSVVFAVLTIVGANVYIPLMPVPVTLQTLFVLLAGAAIGGRYGTLSQVLYVGMGAAGVPVFAGHLGGLSVFAGPTGGYLLSFLIVPYLVSRLMGRLPTLRRQVFSFSVGTGLIFVMGVSHLAVVYTSDLSLALRLGMLPFIPGAIFKIFAATSITRSYQALRSRSRSRRSN
jgi:biotin transport system substrate-specific component